MLNPHVRAQPTCAELNSHVKNSSDVSMLNLPVNAQLNMPLINRLGRVPIARFGLDCWLISSARELRVWRPRAINLDLKQLELRVMFI